MTQQRIDMISGLIGAAVLSVFIIGLAESISSGLAGFWGGLPFWVISVCSLALVWYDYWNTSLRRK